MLIRYLVNLFKISIFGILSTLPLNAFDWQLDALVDMAMPECTLNNIPATLEEKAAGICAKFYEEDNLLASTEARLILSAIEAGYEDDATIFYDEFLSQYGGTFGLGDQLVCTIGGESDAMASLGDLCRKSSDIVLSSMLTLSTMTVDAGGVYTGGLLGDKGVKVDDREYLNNNGKDLYRETTITDEDGNTKVVKGGMALSEIEKDSHSPVAKAIISDDIATQVLTDMALKNLGVADPNKIVLPATKADSIEDVDDAVAILESLDPDFNELIDRIAGDLQKFYEKTISIGGPDCETMITLDDYSKIEANVTETFFKDSSYIRDVYENIALITKAKLASQYLLQTAEEGYIFDPSEARARYISKEYKIAFRYASFIQQEKTKVIQEKYVMEGVRMRRLMDLAKKQAQIKARLFIPDIAKCEIDRLLLSVDQTITY